MVIAGVTIEEKSSRKLKALGVKDSKELSPKRREKLYGDIEKLAKDIIVLKVAPCRIDTYRKMGVNLDKIEAMKMAEIIDFNSTSKIFIDSLTHNPKRFKKLVSSFAKSKNTELIVENYMDESVVVVGAASIVAKVERDKEIKELEETVGEPLGVGYSHDRTTVNFVEKVIKESKGKELPDYIRKTWVTTEILQEKTWQRKVKEFIFGEKTNEQGPEGHE